MDDFKHSLKLGNAGLTEDSSATEVLMINYMQNQITKSLQNGGTFSDIESVMRQAGSDFLVLFDKAKLENNIG